MADIEENGIKRHLLTREELEELYKKIDNLVADCTYQEFQEHKESFIDIKTLIHQRINEN